MCKLNKVKNNCANSNKVNYKLSTNNQIYSCLKRSNTESNTIKKSKKIPEESDRVKQSQAECLFPRKNEVSLEAICTKFFPMTMMIYLDILKELETHFKMRYDWLKSEERPVSYSILKKPHKLKNPAELIVKLSSCQVVKLSSCQVEERAADKPGVPR